MTRDAPVDTGVSEVAELIHRELQSLLEPGENVQTKHLHPSTPIVDTGLDSIDFAVLVARLEDTLGFDPFVALESAVYPRTLGEFISVYEEHGR